MTTLPSWPFSQEARGQVRWLRPDYQAQRGDAGRGVSPDAQDGLSAGVTDAPRRPAFPNDRYEQPLALQAALAHAGGPVGPADLAQRFSGGARLTSRIGRVLTTLHRYGHVERLSDGRWISARA